MANKITNLNEQIKLYHDTGKPELMRNMIFENNYNLIHTALNNMGLHKKRVYNRDYEELEQEASILFLECLDKYNYDLGYSFTTYFYQYIKQVLRRTEVYQKEDSLDAPLKDYEDENLNLLDIVEDEKATEFFEEVELDSERKEIRNRLTEILTDEEKDVIYQYYGFNKEIDTPTYQQLADKYGVSAYDIRVKIERARRKIRRDNSLKYIYNEYEKVRLFDTGSIIELGGKTNVINNPTEKASLRRIELQEGLKQKYDKFILEEMKRINIRNEYI